MIRSAHARRPIIPYPGMVTAFCLSLAGLPPSSLIGDVLPPPEFSHLPEVEMETAAPPAQGGTLPLPTWGDRAPELSPRLWPGSPGSPTQNAANFVPEIQLPPEIDPTAIPDLYLTDYFGSLPASYLVDPQTLLTAHERQSIDRALHEHLTNYKLPVYILLFDKKQEIPEFQNLTALQTRWFGDRPGVVIGFWLASPARTSAYFGHALRKEFGSQLDKAFSDALGQSYTKTYPFSQLDQFTYTLLWRLAHLDSDAGTGPATKPGAHANSTPPEFPPIDSGGWIPVAALGLALATTVATGGAGFILFRRKRERLRLQPKPLILPVARRSSRLGGPHCGGSGASIKVGHPTPKIPS